MPSLVRVSDFRVIGPLIDAVLSAVVADVIMIIDATGVYDCRCCDVNVRTMHFAALPRTSFTRTRTTTARDGSHKLSVATVLGTPSGMSFALTQSPGGVAGPAAAVDVAALADALRQLPGPRSGSVPSVPDGEAAAVEV